VGCAWWANLSLSRWLNPDLSRNRDEQGTGMSKEQG